MTNYAFTTVFPKTESKEFDFLLPYTEVVTAFGFGKCRSPENLRCLGLQGSVSRLYAVHRSPKLHTLWLVQTLLSDLSDLSGHEELSHINVTKTPIRTLKGLRDLPKLEQLLLKTTMLESLDWIENLPGLKRLNISNYSRVRSLRPLVALSNLTALNLSNSPVTDLVGIGHLTELKSLILRSTRIKNLEEISAYRNLAHLNIRHTGVFSLEPLRNVKSLKYLNIVDTEVIDLRPLFEIDGLRIRMRNFDVYVTNGKAIAYLTGNKSALAKMQSGLFYRNDIEIRIMPGGG